MMSGVQYLSHPLTSGVAYAAAQQIYSGRGLALDRGVAMNVAEQATASIGAELLTPQIHRLGLQLDDSLLRPVTTGALVAIADKFVLKKEGSLLYNFLLSVGAEAVAGQVLDRGLSMWSKEPAVTVHTSPISTSARMPPRDRFLG